MWVLQWLPLLLLLLLVLLLMMKRLKRLKSLKMRLELSAIYGNPVMVLWGMGGVLWCLHEVVLLVVLVVRL